jgi:hypothetical protein
MAQNNLKIVYQNVVELATLAASSTIGSLNVSNLKKEQRSYIWRSAPAGSSTVRVNLRLDDIPTLPSGIDTIVGTFTNLTVNATITVLGYTFTPVLDGTVGSPTIDGTATGTPLWSSGPISCRPYSSNKDSVNYTTLSTSYGLSADTIRVFLPEPVPTSVTCLIIQINDTGNTNQNISMSHLIVGASWTPIYNTGYGISLQTSDSSTNNRTESGDLITKYGVTYNSLKFDLTWLTDSDRQIMEKICKRVGLRKPVFVSLFPNNILDYEKERSYQIYGKFKNLNAITHPTLNFYSSTVEIEEL